MNLSQSRNRDSRQSVRRFGKRQVDQLGHVRFWAGIALAATFVLAALALAATSTAAAELQRYEATQRQMGVRFTIVLYSNDAQTANRAHTAAFARIGKLNDALSDYDPKSELSRLSAASPTPQPVVVSDDLWRVLDRSQKLAQQTKGAFDITVGPYTRLWRRARRRQELPTAIRLAAAKKASGYEQMKLDASQQSVELMQSDMRLDLGGIAKGYAADEALKTLKKMGISRAMIDGSGDITLGDPPPGKKGWRIGVAPLRPDAKPSCYLLLANCAVATSGDAFQHVEIAGQRYSHIIDPATGLGLTQRSSVTVVAPDGLTADSLASAVSVLGLVAGTKLVEGQAAVESIIVSQSDDDKKPKTTRSTGLAQYVEE